VLAMQRMRCPVSSACEADVKLQRCRSKSRWLYNPPVNDMTNCLPLHRPSTPTCGHAYTLAAY
jgi:hypothetical protein